MARYRMPVRCGWCHKLIKVSWANRPGVESTGICPACKREVERKAKLDKEARDAR